MLVGHAGFYNRGCEAIVRSTCQLLREEFENPEIVLSSFDRSNDKGYEHDLDIRIISASSNKLWKRYTKDWFLRQLYGLFKNEEKIKTLTYSSMMQFIKSSDAVISLGGDNYTADYGDLPYFLNLNKLVRRFRKKLIIWGASIGPFPEDDTLNEIVEQLKAVDLITVRETKSFEYLKSLGISKNVKLVADPAFLLIPDEKSTECIFYDIGAPILGFNISPILANYTNKLTDEEIIKECTLFLQKVIKDNGFHILFIPHVTKKMGLNNDYNFMEKIFNNLKNTSAVKSVSSEYNAMQLKSIISKCNFFIGARTHATIAALSTGVPTLSIGYSVKSKGINMDLFGHNDFVLDIKDLSAELLFDKFIQLCSMEREIKKILSVQIPNFKELARKNAGYLKEIL